MAAVLLFLPVFLTAQEPAWILLEQADHAYRRRDLGRALQLYGEALADQPLLAEARLGMARVYRYQGDSLVSIRMYRQVLDQARQLQVPDDRYSIQLELADLYHELGDIEAERRLLREITAEDPVFRPPGGTPQRSQMIELLRTVGINRVIVLYRLDFPQALEAHRRLSRLLLERGAAADRDDALAHAMFAVVEITGRGVDAIIERDPYFQFSTIDGFLRESARYRPVQAYLENVRYMESLDLLRDAIRAHPDEAFRRHLSDLPD